jgi:hypothetical protein
MTLEELEEALEDILPPGFHIETNTAGELIIHTRLTQDDDGELIDFEDDEDLDEDEDPDFEPLEDEDVDDE